MPIINGAGVDFVQNSSYKLLPLRGPSMHSIYGQPLSVPHTPTTMITSNSMPMCCEWYQNTSRHFGDYYPRSIPHQLPLQSYNASTFISYIEQSAGSNTSEDFSASATYKHAMHPLQPAMSPGYGPQNLIPDPDTPTHVVGSQGRRGVLPSAPGRLPVTATGTGSTKNAAIPAKDANGKFPCPHCTKTYLHAKHLKRHLLRHTGDRPYMCVLCGDAFSRSDILKRHFQKCSIRRGNPTGASNLSAQAHLNSSSRPAVKGQLRSMNGMNSLPVEPNVVHQFGVTAVHQE